MCNSRKERNHLNAVTKGSFASENSQGIHKYSLFSCCFCDQQDFLFQVYISHSHFHDISSFHIHLFQRVIIPCQEFQAFRKFCLFSPRAVTVLFVRVSFVFRTDDSQLFILASLWSTQERNITRQTRNWEVGMLTTH